MPPTSWLLMCAMALSMGSAALADDASGDARDTSTSTNIEHVLRAVRAIDHGALPSRWRFFIGEWTISDADLETLAKAVIASPLEPIASSDSAKDNVRATISATLNALGSAKRSIGWYVERIQADDFRVERTCTPEDFRGWLGFADYCLRQRAANKSYDVLAIWTDRVVAATASRTPYPIVWFDVPYILKPLFTSEDPPYLERTGLTLPAAAGWVSYATSSSAPERYIVRVRYVSDDAPLPSHIEVDDPAGVHNSVVCDVTWAVFDAGTRPLAVRTIQRLDAQTYVLRLVLTESFDEVDPSSGSNRIPIRHSTAISLQQPVVERLAYGQASPVLQSLMRVVDAPDQAVNEQDLAAEESNDAPSSPHAPLALVSILIGSTIGVWILWRRRR